MLIQATLALPDRTISESTGSGGIRSNQQLNKFHLHRGRADFTQQVVPRARERSDDHQRRSGVSCTSRFSSPITCAEIDQSALFYRCIRERSVLLMFTFFVSLMSVYIRSVYPRYGRREPPWLERSVRTPESGGTDALTVSGRDDADICR